jgi:hypothetical protein
MFYLHSVYYNSICSIYTVYIITPYVISTQCIIQLHMFYLHSVYYNSICSIYTVYIITPYVISTQCIIQLHMFYLHSVYYNLSMVYLHSVYYNSICYIYTVGGSCLEFLVSGADGVTDDKPTASSVFLDHQGHGPARARLDTPNFVMLPRHTTSISGHTKRLNRHRSIW